MRAFMKVVGMGQRKQGVSAKTNKSYDFQPVSFTYIDTYTTGLKACTCNVSGADIDSHNGLMIGEEYDVVFHNYNGGVVVDAIL